MKVAATVYITLDATENQSGRVRRPAEGTFALKPWASATLALTTLIVAPMGGIKVIDILDYFLIIIRASLMTKWGR